ncbi:MAG: PilZ domain-containing protein [Sphingobium sp.]|nr:PilZ domain-containing protein [Sphingobium sp.]
MNEGQSQEQGERRSGERQVSVLLHAGIAHGGKDGLCRIRNLSSGGVMLESNLPLMQDDDIRLQLRSGHQVRGRVRWVLGNRAGIAFHDPADALLFTGTPQKLMTDVVSPIGYPLFERHGPVRLDSGRGHATVPLLMVSPAGIIVADPPLWPGETVYTVHIRGLDTFKARVGEQMMMEEGEALSLLFVEPPHHKALNDWLTSYAAVVGDAPDDEGE